MNTGTAQIGLAVYISGSHFLFTYSKNKNEISLKLLLIVIKVTAVKFIHYIHPFEFILKNQNQCKLNIFNLYSLIIDFSNDSMQGIVWHSTIKLLPEQNRSQSQINGNNNNVSTYIGLL